VRRAARRGLLAYAFLRGKPYANASTLAGAELTGRPPASRIALHRGVWEVVKRFGGAWREAEVGAWLALEAKSVDLAAVA